MPSLDCDEMTAWGVGGSGDPNFILDVSSSWVERSLHAKFQLPRKLPPISLLFWAAGLLEESKLRITGAELGNNMHLSYPCSELEILKAMLL